MPPKIADVFNPPRQATPPVQLLGTPNTRKRRQNYYNLHNYGLQESSQASSSQTEPIFKRSRFTNPPPVEELIAITQTGSSPSPTSPTPLVRRINKKNETIQKYA
jgi:hypothetical protein